MRPASCGDVEALDKFAVRGISRWRKVTQLLRLHSNDTTATTQEKDELQVNQISYSLKKCKVTWQMAAHVPDVQITRILKL